MQLSCNNREVELYLLQDLIIDIDSTARYDPMVHRIDSFTIIVICSVHRGSSTVAYKGASSFHPPDYLYWVPAVYPVRHTPMSDPIYPPHNSEEKISLKKNDDTEINQC